MTDWEIECMQIKFIEELLWIQKFEIELKKPEPETDLEICGFGSKNKKKLAAPGPQPFN